MDERTHLTGTKPANAGTGHRSGSSSTTRPCATACSRPRSSPRPSNRRSRSSISWTGSRSAADIGLPGAGPHVVRDVTLLAQEIVSAKLKIAANCAARTIIARHRAVVDVVQKTGLPIEGLHVHRVLAHPPVRGELDEETMLHTRDAVTFAVREGARSCTSPRTRSRASVPLPSSSSPRSNAAKRLCLCDTVGHATPSGVQPARLRVRGRRRKRRRRRTRLARPQRPRARGDQHDRRHRAWGDARARLRDRHRRTRGQHAHGPVARELAAARLDRERPHLTHRVLREDVARHRRAGSRELPDGRRRRVPHRHRHCTRPR